MKRGWWKISFTLEPNKTDLDHISKLIKRGFIEGIMTQEDDGSCGEDRRRSECYSCKFMREVPGNAHIKCIYPDPYMIGSDHGIKNGWFFYPILFDPVWKEKLCNNYEEKEQL